MAMLISYFLGKINFIFKQLLSSIITLSNYKTLHYHGRITYPENMKRNKTSLLALKKEVRSMEYSRLFFIFLLLHGSSAHAWENQRPLHNTHCLNSLLKTDNPETKKL